MSENINIEVGGQPIAVVEIIVDENSAQAAKDAAAAAQSVLEEIQSSDFAGFLPKAEYPGTAQDLDNDIKAIKFPDQILEYGDISLQGLNITINANEFQWRLNQAVFNNTAFINTIAPATNGFFRTDLLQVTSDNLIRIKTGNEDAISSITPSIDEGYLALGSVNIFGNVVASTNTLDTSSFNVFSPVGPLDFTLVNSSATTLLIHNATSLTGFTIPTNKIQYGKDYYVRNNTGGPLTLKSATGTNNIRFYFAEGDLVVPVHNNVHLKYLSNGEFGGIGYLTLVGINPSNTQIKDNQIPITTNIALSAIYNGQTLIISASVSITIPAILPDEFTFNAIVRGAGAVTWAITSPHVFDATVGFNGGTEIPTGKYFNFTKVGNNIIIAV